MTLNQQKQLIHEDPEAYLPVKGAWGKRGATILLRAAEKATVLEALTAACATRRRKRSSPAIGIGWRCRGRNLYWRA
jgi:hypothetical protein